MFCAVVTNKQRKYIFNVKTKPNTAYIIKVINLNSILISYN